MAKKNIFSLFIILLFAHIAADITAIGSPIAMKYNWNCWSSANGIAAIKIPVLNESACHGTHFFLK